MNESVKRDTFEDFKAELDKLGRAEDIGKSAPGTLNLLQVACERGLPKHLEAMLKIEGTQVKYKTMTLRLNGKTVLIFKILNIIFFIHFFFL